jgi:hypothetical protein
MLAWPAGRNRSESGGSRPSPSRPSVAARPRRLRERPVAPVTVWTAGHLPGGAGLTVSSVWLRGAAGTPARPDRPDLGVVGVRRQVQASRSREPRCWDAGASGGATRSATPTKALARLASSAAAAWSFSPDAMVRSWYPVVPCTPAPMEPGRPTVEPWRASALSPSVNPSGVPAPSSSACRRSTREPGGKDALRGPTRRARRAGAGARRASHRLEAIAAQVQVLGGLGSATGSPEAGAALERFTSVWSQTVRLMSETAFGLAAAVGSSSAAYAAVDSSAMQPGGRP